MTKEQKQKVAFVRELARVAFHEGVVQLAVGDISIRLLAVRNPAADEPRPGGAAQRALELAAMEHEKQDRTKKRLLSSDEAMWADAIGGQVPVVTPEKLGDDRR